MVILNMTLKADTEFEVCFGVDEISKNPLLLYYKVSRRLYKNAGAKQIRIARKRLIRTLQLEHPVHPRFIISLPE